MKKQRVWAIARKEIIHIVRDPWSLGMAIAIPMLLLVLYGYALTLDVDKVPMLVWDQSNTPVSRDLVSRFQGSRYFSVRNETTGYDQIERAIASGDALCALVIPLRFSGLLESGRTAQVQFIVDGSDANTATIAIGYAQAVVAGRSREIMVQHILAKGLRPPENPIDFRPRVWFNADLESRNYIVPGLIAVIMMVIAALLTSLTVAREWERGTMEQLISTPVKGPELILGKLIPYFGIGMLDVLISVLMGEFLFRVPLRGSILLLFSVSAIFLVGALSVGMLISIVTRSQLLSSQIAMVVTYLPALLLSGFMFSIGNMPQPLQVITHIIPARYFVTLLKGIYLKGVGLETLGLEAALLTIFGFIMVAMARLRFRKKLE